MTRMCRSWHFSPEFGARYAQVEFYDDELDGHGKRVYRLEELFNRMANEVRVLDAGQQAKKPKLSFSTHISPIFLSPCLDWYRRWGSRKILCRLSSTKPRSSGAFRFIRLSNTVSRTSHDSVERTCVCVLRVQVICALSFEPAVKYCR